MNSLRQQAHDLINASEIDALFELLEKYVGKQYDFSALRKEFISGTKDYAFHQRLHAWVNENITPEIQGIENFDVLKFALKNEYNHIAEKTHTNRGVGTSEILQDKNIEDLEQESLQNLFEQERSLFMLGEDVDTLTTREKLRRLSLAENGHIFKGTFLTLGIPYQLHTICPSASYSNFTYFKGIERLHDITFESVVGNILKQYNRMLFLLRQNIPLKRDRTNDQDIYEVPIEALREFVANAFVHRDYDYQVKTDVAVEIFDDRIEIKNPGAFPQGLNLAKITDGFYINSTIMSIFFLHKHVERRGTGINKAQAVLQQHGLPPALIEQYENPSPTVKVTVYRPQKDIQVIQNDETKQTDIPKFLTHFISVSTFIGRQAEFETLHEYLQAGKRTVLVNGLGGVGKTTLAQKYVQEHQHEYEHILWLRQSGSIVTSFINPTLFRNLGIPLETGKNMYAPFYDALRALKILQGNNLLVIDNYELTDTDLENDSFGKLCTLPTTWRVLCTSRNDVDFFDETIRLNVLPAHEAIQVFQAHTGGKPADSAEVGELLKMIGYHTLMTELLAKTYKQTMQFATVGKLHAYLKERSLQDQQLNKKIYVDRQATTLYAHLNAVFSLASLTEDELWMLKQWIVLPTTPHQATDFLTWIQDADLAYENTLLALAEKGWLQTDNRLAYSLHPFLQLFLHQTLKPTLPDCEKIWEYFVDLISSEKIEAYPLAYQWTIAIGEAMIQYIDFTDHKIEQGKLWDRIRFVYMLLGDYPNAIRCVKEAINIIKTTVGKVHRDYADYLNNLAVLYSKQGNYAEALPLYQESLQISEDVLGKQNFDYVTSLNNLANLYSDQENYTEALPLYQEVLQIVEKLEGKKHRYYAISLNNLAMLYKNQSNYAEALSLFQEALQIREEVLGKTHPAYAETLHNIGTLYYKQGNYTQARQYIEEAYSIFLEKVGEQHPNTQAIKSWLNHLPDNV